MILLIATALATASTPPNVRSATAQATATIRVISAATLKLDGSPNPGLPAPRDTSVKSVDGTVQSARLIEFQ